MTDAFWVLWFAGCLLAAYGLIRAARDYRDDEPHPAPAWGADRQTWRHDEPADPDRKHGTDDILLATCRHLWHLPDHQPNHRTEEGR